MRTASTKPGDAVRFADAQEPRQGLVFERPPGGRLQAHDGNVGACRRAARRALAAASPALQDAIVAGENREFIGLLAWLNAAGCHKLIGGEAPLGELAPPSAVRAHVAQVIARWNAGHPASSERIGAPSYCCRRALDRRQRDHRQGLHQPAAGARAAEGRCRAALCTQRRCDVIVV